MEKIAIIIPAYNEEKRIGRTLKSYIRYFDILKKEETLDYNVIVVINNSNDGTEEIVKTYLKKNSTISYINLVEGGKGNAVIEGFKEALKQDNSLIGFSDADMATSPEEFYKLMVACKKFDCVIGDRYLKESSITPSPSFGRLLAKRAFNIISRSILLLPFRDTQCGAKIFKKDVLRNIIPSLTMSKWAFDVELLYNINKKGYQIKSIPIKWVDEEYSTINFWKSGPGMVLGILRLRIINSPFKDIMRLYDRMVK